MLKGFFKKYNKLKSTYEIVTKQKFEIEQEIEYIESVIYSVNNALSIEELNDVYDEISGILVKPSKVKNTSNKKRILK